MEQELQLKGKQLMSDLKGEIHHRLSCKVLKEPIKEAFSDTKFIQSSILEAINSWKPTDELELMLPRDLENKLEKSFQYNILYQLKNLTITFHGKLQEGFRISEKSGAYQISFTEEDFISLFTPYLEEQTTKILFNKVT
jgi:V/A-type H+-transporting ATPase subunit E